jgi:hypothetical protein
MKKVKATKTTSTKETATKETANAAPKAATKEAAASFLSTLTTKAKAVAALAQRDQIAIQRVEEELKARRDAVWALDEFIWSVLERPDFKTLAKPGAAVVRVLKTEKGMTNFTANSAWNEFRLVCTNNH